MSSISICSQGLDFLATVCESQITSQLSDEEFGKFKESIGQCVGHIIGSTALDTQSINVIGSSLKSPQLTSVRRFSKLTSNNFKFSCNKKKEKKQIYFF